MNFSYKVFIVILLAATIVSCKQTPIPKPRGYYRIDLPEKEYRQYRSDCPFTFEYPRYGKITTEGLIDPGPCWFNIYFPEFRGRIHISYRKIDNDLGYLIEDAHTLAYKHTIKADAIEEKSWTDTSRQVYGMMYDLKGNTASSVQFYLTDSTNHYLRGSLYFRTEPRIDSLAPVIRFFREDIIHLIETFEWADR